MRVAVDIGGTFTDFVCLDETTGRIIEEKAHTTPANFADGVIHAVKKSGISLDEVTYFVHGTTVVINAVTERKGAKTALVTTKGFRDVLEIGRANRPDMYNYFYKKPVPYVPRYLRFEVDERVDFEGRVLKPADPAEIKAIAAALKREGIEAVAVCLLNSYANPETEQLTGRLLAAELPEAEITVSSDLLKVWREYERTSTTVLNAYVKPAARLYLDTLKSTLKELGLTEEPHAMQSNGGTATFDRAKEIPGPGQDHQRAQYHHHGRGRHHGQDLPVQQVRGQNYHRIQAGMDAPLLRLSGEIGAGGGSIAWIDSGSHLRVGPQSAGAFPGPACYGNGSRPTVTDANVVLHLLNPEYLLNGQMKISEDAAIAAVHSVGDPLGLEVHEAALGILRVVTANMARAIRVVSVQRGYDPRDYALVPFGGAGPLHASRLARELSISKVVVPEIPGAQSAMGLLMTDVRTDFMRTQITALDPHDPAAIAQVLEELEAQAAAWFTAEGTPADEQSLVRRLEMRYRGQNFELPIDIEGEHGLEAEALAKVVAAFHDAHERVYGFHAEDDPIEVVTFRVQAVGRAERLELIKSEIDGESSDPALVTEREIFLSTEFGFRKCPVYERGKLRPGNQLAGPAIVEQMDTTTVLLPGDSCVMDEYRNLVIEIGAQQ